MNWRTIGFEKQKKFFIEAVKNGSLDHAYLFHGPAMIGKQLFAFDLYELINNRTASINEPDFLFVSPKSEKEEGTKIYIENIRGLKTFLSLKPYFGPYKFILINDAERLTPEASNALLKTLEEPTPNTILVLISNSSRSLLPTITSRCQVINFLPHSERELIDFIEINKIFKYNKEFLLPMAQGRIGWLKWANENIKEIDQSINDLKKIIKGNTFEKIAYVKKIYEKETYPVAVASWLHWLYNHQSEIPESGHILKELIKLNNIISQPQYNHRLALENALLNF
jgi:DNA polymerase III delta prime subunit